MATTNLQLTLDVNTGSFSDKCVMMYIVNANGTLGAGLFSVSPYMTAVGTCSYTCIVGYDYTITQNKNIIMIKGGYLYSQWNIIGPIRVVDFA